ncbi:hypothetical protein V7114_08610 [Neobacillus niacini]|uniref:hypothetical protein n=1 Tax=Neobacillus niacini TaxID=86668 RepID=UPI003000D122
MDITEFYFPSDYGRSAFDEKRNCFLGQFNLNGYWFNYLKKGEQITIEDADSRQDALWVIQEIGEENVKNLMRVDLEHSDFLEKFANADEDVLFIYDNVSVEQIGKGIRVRDLRLENEPGLFIELSWTSLEEPRLIEMITFNEQKGGFSNSGSAAMSDIRKAAITKTVFENLNLLNF